MNGGYMNRAYDVDLSSGQIRQIWISSEDRRLYLGGKGIGTRLLYDHTQAGLDPYDEKMVIVFSTGPVTGTAAPQSNRFVVTTKSPLTGAIANSTCGGSFATKLKKAGVDLVLVRGRAEKPVYIEITEAGAEIKDASHLWGKGTLETQKLLPKGFGMAVIGPAGENRVRFASVVSGERLAGRTGCGAVMGSKNLKGIIANGKKRVPVADGGRFKQIQRSITNYINGHPMTGDILPRLGTANLVMTTAGRNILPVHNFQRGSDPRAAHISGELMADTYLKKRRGCLSCPIVCGRGIELKGQRDKGPEYETIGMMGANIGCFDLERIFEWSHILDDLGMDSISTGGVIAFATELTQRGLLSSDLSFDRHDGISQLLQDIAHRRGLGNDLAEGVRRMSDKYGGKAFALHVKGLELPAYDPRGCYGQGLEYATTNRGGCHIQGSSMYLEATGPLSIDPLSTRFKPELAVLMQNLSAALSSSVFCHFAMYAAVPALAFSLDPQGKAYNAVVKALLNAGPLVGLVLKTKWPLSLPGVSLAYERVKPYLELLWFERFLSQVMGEPVSLLDFIETGERVFNLGRMYNLREGFTAEDDTLPHRMLHEPTFPGKVAGVPLYVMLEQYYRVRGWDDSGVPKPSTLKRLEIRS